MMKQQPKWIASPVPSGETVLTFCRDFSLSGTIQKATISLTAYGVYALFFNGCRVGDAVLTPGWTQYEKRIQYQTYDITESVRECNRIEVGVASGWAFGTLLHRESTWNGHRFWGKIRLQYKDGTAEEIVSDETWEVCTNEVTFADLYNGETVDKTAKIKKLGNAVLSDTVWHTVKQVGERIVENERLAPTAIFRTPNGELVIDFGQNLAGYVEIRMHGQRGDRIVLHHAEVLDRDGNFYNANYRSAENKVTYILSGGDDILKPTYTFQGFRYIRLTEFPFAEADPSSFRAIAVHSELKRTGSFVCGNEKINQLYHNIIWGQKSNYLDVPTDCPQRDERLGWTGDAQVFCRTAAINFDVERFFVKWMQDVALSQHETGLISDIVPFVSTWVDPETGMPNGGHTGWADVACIVPWQMYLAYGNKKVLRSQYPMMKKWVRFMQNFGEDEYLFLGQWHYGDWLAMDGDPDQCVGATPPDFIACAFYAYSVSLTVKAGKALGEDVREYEALYAKVRNAFRNRYIVDGALRLLPNTVSDPNDPPLPKETQTAYALVLYFGLSEGEETAHFASRLANMIRANGNRMTTVFLGTPYLLHALSQNGYTELAYTLLMQEESPSWLYSVNHGATTMWEHWNSIKEDGSFWSTSMNSFNHYAYGAVYDWIFGVAIGIQPTEHAPAYREFLLEPHPHPCLGFADASIQSRNGKIRSHWYYKGNTVFYEFEIPQGTIAHLRLPSGLSTSLPGGIYHFSDSGIRQDEVRS